ncbi:MAG: HAMP domain-containing protein [Anaerolineae bacterium]|nr:HAMP domain-containing protein [Anaerolineae bacterium]
MRKLGRAFRKLRSSFRFQLMLATAAPVIFFLTILTLVALYGFTRMTQTLVEQRDAELVQLAAQQVADYWADSVLLLTQVASTNEVRRGSLSSIQKLLIANKALLQRFDEISMTDPQGMIIASAGGKLGDQLGQYPFFERARRLRRPVCSRLYENSLGRQVISVAIPVYDIWGRFAGCLIGTWDLHGDRLGLSVANIRVGQRGFAYLVNESGIILYHPDPELIGADASRHPAVAALLQGKTGAQTIRTQGQTVVVGYAPIPLRRLSSSLLADESWEGWGLLTSELWDDIIAPLQPYARSMLVLLILVVIIPLAILAITSRSIVAPLQSLLTQVERVASGEFDTQVSINSGPSEMRDLELAFNTMVKQLRKYRDDIQNYVVSILNSQEEERKRIARELHDETAQALIVLGRQIEMAQELTNDPTLISELEKLRDMVDATLQGVRRFTRDLRPPLLEELGLPRTLEILGSRTAREEPFTVDVRIVGEPYQLMPELELGLFRLAQESLSNVRRHAQATHVDLTLTYAKDRVVLEIVDNGIGFNAPQDPAELMRSGRLGLMGIYERARLFGGKAEILSEPGKGTIVRVIVPLSAIVLPTDAQRT